MSIPYYNPLTRKNTLYVPDFLVVYRDKRGQEITEMIEVKPKDEMPGAVLKEGNARSLNIKRGRQIMNQAKWAEAVKFCQRRGWKFRVASETDMFAFRKKA